MNEREPRWNAGAVGRIPEDDSLVYRDDAVTGPQFYARSVKDAETAAEMLNAIEEKLARALVALDELFDGPPEVWVDWFERNKVVYERGDE